jgi:hypothetical protein
MSGSDEASQGDIARPRTQTINPAWLDEIERRILRAEAPADFVPDLASEWGRSRRRVWVYVARVRARLAERGKAADPDADRETIRAMALEAYRTARLGNEKGADAKGMVAAAKLFGDITGTLAPVKMDVTSNGKPIAAMTDDELRAHIAGLKDRVAG